MFIKQPLKLQSFFFKSDTKHIHVHIYIYVHVNIKKSLCHRTFKVFNKKPIKRNKLVFSYLNFCFRKLKNAGS